MLLQILIKIKYLSVKHNNSKNVIKRSFNKLTFNNLFLILKHIFSYRYIHTYFDI